MTETSGQSSGLKSIGKLLIAAGGARLIVLPLTGLCNLAIARIVTQAVGIEQFGVVMLVATLCQLLMFADLGTGAAVASSAHNSMSRATPRCFAEPFCRPCG